MKVIYIKDDYRLIKNNIYNVVNSHHNSYHNCTYYYIETTRISFDPAIEKNPCKLIKLYDWYNIKDFISLSEWRDKQIEEILNG